MRFFTIVMYETKYFTDEEPQKMSDNKEFDSIFRISIFHVFSNNKSKSDMHNMFQCLMYNILCFNICLLIKMFSIFSIF